MFSAGLFVQIAVPKCTLLLVWLVLLCWLLLYVCCYWLCCVVWCFLVPISKLKHTDAKVFSIRHIHFVLIDVEHVWCVELSCSFSFLSYMSHEAAILCSKHRNAMVSH